MAAKGSGLDAQSDPSDYSSTLDLLAWASQSRSPSDVVRGCDRILAADPAHLPALEMKIRALWRMGRFEETLSCLGIALSLNPFDPGYHFLRGDCLLGLQRFSEALSAFERCASSASGALKQQAEVRIRGLQDWQAAVAAELACSDAQFGRQFKTDALAAMESLGLRVTISAPEPKRMPAPAVWARPS